MKKIVFFAVTILLSVSAVSQDVREDALKREYLAPKRVLWTSGSIENTDVLLHLTSGQPDMAREPFCGLSNQQNDTASILLDFGRELHGGLKLVLGHSNKATSHIRIRFGESAAEACSESDGGKNRKGFSSNDHATRDFVLSIPRYGQIEVGSTGFRFVRIDLLDPQCKIQMKEVAAIFRCRAIPYIGSFRCSDQRLNDIWQTGAYTVHLNMQEYLWDGIKRDRAVWLGDMHPEVATIMSVFGQDEVVPRSLDLACHQYPLPQWLNGISSYSLWYLIIQHDWYMHGGDTEFLQKHRGYITGLVDKIEALVDADGTEHMEDNTKSQLKRFLDWPSTPNEKGVEAGYRALIVWAMQDAMKLCEVMGDQERVRKCQEVTERISKKVLPANDLKQAAALMAIAGITDAKKACRDIILKGGAKNFSTFYGYYMLQALALAGEYQQAMDIIRDYWGGMLDLGATTFWEDFNLDWMQNAARIDELVPEGKVDIHREYGDYCYLSYRHSLCHGWASGPTAWLTQHVLGVEVVDAGCRTLRVTPHLGNLQWAEGTFPTPLGTVSIRHDKNEDGSIRSEINAPDGINIIGQTRRTPIMGWSSWNTYRINISDTLIKKQADAMVAKGLKDAGYTYINIDDGFFGYRDKKGEMHPHPQRFPGGMKAVADHIHSLGLKAGIYSDAGAVTCGSIWDKDKNGIGAGLYGHEEQDARLYFRDWGYDFIKIDYCGAGQELDLDEHERYTAIRQAIDQTGRKDVEVNICRWAFPGTWAKDLAASWRISEDIRDKWSSVKHIVEKNMPLSAYCRDGHFNDMDMLEIGRSLSQSEERVHFGLWCMMSSPLLIGCDMTTIRDHSLQLLKNQELVSLNQDTLGLQAYPVQVSEGTYVLVKDIEERRGKVRAIALYNPTDTLRHISIALSELELGGKVKLRDLFAHQDIKTVMDSVSADVAPHDVVILRAEAEQRLEPTRYEAEWAYLPLFNDLGKRKKEIHYATDNKASGGLVVRNAGGRRENSIIWDNVWSERGGNYKMTITYTPNENRGLEVIINGKSIIVPLDDTGIVSIQIMLHQGNNKVEMTSRTTWTPDIDKFEIDKKQIES